MVEIKEVDFHAVRMARRWLFVARAWVVVAGVALLFPAVATLLSGLAPKQGAILAASIAVWFVVYFGLCAYAAMWADRAIVMTNGKRPP